MTQCDPAIGMAKMEFSCFPSDNNRVTMESNNFAPRATVLIRIGCTSALVSRDELKAAAMFFSTKEK